VSTNPNLVKDEATADVSTNQISSPENHAVVVGTHMETITAQPCGRNAEPALAKIILPGGVLKTGERKSTNPQPADPISRIPTQVIVAVTVTLWARLPSV
jgi:hypothetical protein